MNNYDPNMKINLTLSHADVSMLVQGLTAINNSNAKLVDELNTAFFAALNAKQATTEGSENVG